MDMKLFHGDCLDVMSKLRAGSVDMVLCDLPYGTTACKWDSIIAFDQLWNAYRRLIKRNGVIVLTATQPFTSALIMSNISLFRYEWIWNKNMGSGFASAKHQPMRYHESLLVFYDEKPTYNPQPTSRNSEASEKRVNSSAPVRGGGARTSKHTPMPMVIRRYDPKTKGPESVLRFDSVPNGGGKKLHPTQKPVPLMEYMIKTYTNPDDTVLDNCMGSGTTGVACKLTGRRFIGIEKEAGYFDIARTRIKGTAV